MVNYKNYKRKSVTGLSILMFTFTVIGNTATFTSILIYSNDTFYIYKNIEALASLLSGWGSLAIKLAKRFFK